MCSVSNLPLIEALNVISALTENSTPIPDLFVDGSEEDADYEQDYYNDPAEDELFSINLGFLRNVPYVGPYLSQVTLKPRFGYYPSLALGTFVGMSFLYSMKSIPKKVANAAERLDDLNFSESFDSIIQMAERADSELSKWLGFGDDEEENEAEEANEVDVGEGTDLTRAQQIALINARRRKRKQNMNRVPTTTEDQNYLYYNGNI